MKKFGKFLTVLLAVALAVTALVVVIGAADDTDANVTIVTTPGEFVTAFNASPLKDIKLGADIDISSAFSANGVTVQNKTFSIDLGGHTLTMGSRYFNVKMESVLTITGTGTIQTSNYIAQACAGGTLTINGTGNDGITIEQKTSGSKIFAIGTATSNDSNVGNMSVTGTLTVKPHSLNSSCIFNVGRQYSGTVDLDDKATLTVTDAKITVTEPQDGNGYTTNAAVSFAFFGDGAVINMTNSTVTMEHGNFIKNGNTTASSTYSSASEALSASKGNRSINISGCTIEANNSGFSKFLTNWCNSDAAGYLFAIGKGAATVNVTDSVLVGTNRTINAGGSETSSGTIYPIYFNFKNVDFTTSTFTGYNSSVLLFGNFNMKWEGGFIEHKNAVVTQLASLGSETDYRSDPFSEAAFEAFKTAYKSEKNTDYSGSYDDFKKLYYAYTTGSPTMTVTQTYCSFDTPATNNGYSTNGFKYVESDEAWSGKLFANCYYKTNWVNASDGNYAIRGTVYQNVYAIKDGEIIKCNYACLDEAPTLIALNTDTLDTANGYYYAQNGSGGEETSGTTALFGDIFEANGNKNKWWGRYSEVKASNGNGYVRLDKYKVASDLSGANVYTGLNYGKSNLYVKNYNYLVHEFDIATESGTFYRLVGSFLTRGLRTEVKVDADGDKYINKSSLSGPWSSQIFDLQKDGDLFNDDSVILPNDGSWTRITVVYEMKAELIEVYTDSEKTETTSLYDYTGSKAHIYVDGTYAKSVNLFDYIYMTTEENDKFLVDQLRCNQYNEEGTTCFDNNRVSAYSATQATKALTTISSDASSVDLNDYTSDFLVMPKANNITLPAATVNWVDANGNLLGTTTPLAGSTVSGVAPEASVLKQANELRNELNNGWFDYGFSGWKVTDAEGKELTSTDTLTQDATYTFTAVCDKPIAPERGVAGIKLNLSLRMNFDLNIYIPVPAENSGISSVTLSNATLSVSDPAGTDSDGKCTVEGDLFFKYRNTYGVAELTSRTYTLEYKVNGVKITQDIVYGVSDYVAQYMAKEDGDELAQKLIMQMVNYAIAVVDHPNSGVSDEIKNSEVVVNYRALLNHDKFKSFVTTTKTNYFSTEAVNNKIATVKARRGNSTDKTNIAYYIDGARLYFGTNSTPTFMFKYSDAAVEIGIKEPGDNDNVAWAGYGLWIYSGYGSYKRNSKHIVYDVGEDNNKFEKIESGDAHWYGYTSSTTTTTTTTKYEYYTAMNAMELQGENSYSVYDMLGGIKIEVYINPKLAGSTATTDWDCYYAENCYCIEEYIADVIAQKNADEPTATQADVDLAIALYDYAKVSYEFVKGTEYTP